jgi:GT2 family glycosyltransferase
MSVAAIIPHWNRRDLLDPLFFSLRSQTRTFDEIIVVDNGSSDDSANLAASLGATVLRLQKNLGFAAAVNRGIQATKADWIAILNNDVTLAPDWLERLLETKASFASGKILNAADHSLIDGTFDEISRAACAWRCGQGRKDSPIWNQPRPIRIAPMTAAIFRKSLFDSIGLLDENFGSFLEDVDFGIRCALRGVPGEYIPEAVAYHRGSATMGAWNKDTVKRIARNQILLIAKHFGDQPRWPIVAGQMLWGLVALRHLRGGSFLRGKISGWKAARALYRENITTSEEPNPCIRISSLAADGEREIFALQQQTGFDRYWRAYFWLLPRSL